MTSDPMFDFNAELADLDNIHTAEVEVSCAECTEDDEPVYQIEFSGGLSGYGEGVLDDRRPAVVASSELKEAPSGRCDASPASRPLPIAPAIAFAAAIFFIRRRGHRG